MTTPNTAPPELIYLIRHGEKPADPPAPVPGQAPAVPTPPLGIDLDGETNPHSLLPRVATIRGLGRAVRPGRRPDTGGTAHPDRAVLPRLR